MARNWGLVAASTTLGMLFVVGGVAGCVPGQPERQPPSLAVGECVTVEFGEWNEVTVVPCSMLDRQHVYQVGAILIGAPEGPGQVGTCPPGVDSEMWSMNSKVGGSVMAGPARRFCFVE